MRADIFERRVTEAIGAILRTVYFKDEDTVCCVLREFMHKPCMPRLTKTLYSEAHLKQAITMLSNALAETRELNNEA